MYTENKLNKMKKDELIGIILGSQGRSSSVKRICASCSWYEKNSQYNNYLCTRGNRRPRQTTDSCSSFSG